MEVIRKSSVNKAEVIVQIEISGLLSPSPFPGTGWETPLQTEVSLMNINVSYKRVASTQCSDLLLCLHFLKNNQLKIIDKMRRHILRWQIQMDEDIKPL